MDYLRLTPRGNLLIISKVSGDESRELRRITIDNDDDMAEEGRRLFDWAWMQMRVGLDLPFREEMVTNES